MRSRCEQGDSGSRNASRGDVLQHLEELLRVMFDRAHTDSFEHRSERPFHRSPILQHVAHSGWTSPIILQNHPFSFVASDQVRATNVDVNILWDLKVDELAPEMFPGKDIRWRYNAVLNNFLLVINIVEEKIERGDALGQAPLEMLPLACRYDSWDEIERKNFLRPAGVPINIKGDALAQKCGINRLTTMFELIRFDRAKELAEPVVM